MIHTMKATKHGNSLVICIPANIRISQNIKPGDLIETTLKNTGVNIPPKTATK